MRKLVLLIALSLSWNFLHASPSGGGVSSGRLERTLTKIERVCKTVGTCVLTGIGISVLGLVAHELYGELTG